MTRVSDQVAAGRSAAAISAITTRTPYGNTSESISGMTAGTPYEDISGATARTASGNLSGNSSETLSGNTASDTASPLPEVDFMTADGVVRGDSRQQVSVQGSAPGMSHVLGHLAEHGIRAGANEALTPTRSYSGEEAFAALFASGQIRGGVRKEEAAHAHATPDGVRAAPISDPESASSAQARLPNDALAASQQAQAQQIREQLQAQVKRQIAQALADPSLDALLSPAISPMTVTDASGSVRLTLAGQAKAQEVYNRLRLDESYKKHADPAIAQAVTLVTAIALTAMSSGTAAPAIANAAGSTAAAAGTTAAAVSAGTTAATATGTAAATAGTAGIIVKAGAIGLGSTMVGQLSAGASFDEAFQAGMKAGLSSAVTAGILNTPLIKTAGGSLQSINQLAEIEQMGYNHRELRCREAEPESARHRDVRNNQY